MLQLVEAQCQLHCELRFMVLEIGGKQRRDALDAIAQRAYMYAQLVGAALLATTEREIQPKCCDQLRAVALVVVPQRSEHCVYES